jgi:crossover junction endodeoxyribonuclease RusA
VTALSFAVEGTPKVQGNHRRNRYGATYEATKGHGPWRRAVIAAAQSAILGWEQRRPLQAGVSRTWEPISDPVSVMVRFRFERPASHYGTGRNARRLRDDAPPLPISGRIGDIDKLERTILDALTAAEVIVDDRVVAHITADKRWCVDSQQPGAAIYVRRWGS